eukprot:109502_1
MSQQVKLINNIKDCGEIQCTFKFNINQSAVTESITVLLDPYTQMITVTQLEIFNDLYSVKEFNNVAQKGSKLILIATIQSTNGDSMTQRMVIELIKNAQKKYIYMFDVISTFYFHQKTTQKNKYCKDYRYNIQINMVEHDIRRYVLYKSVMMLYGLYLSNDVLSTIFDEHYTSIFDVYGDPFLYDTLQLDIQKFNQYTCMLRWSDPVQTVHLLSNKYSNKIQQCNVNGLGINIQVTKEPFDIIINDIEEILNAYDLSILDAAEAIWPATHESLITLEKLQSDLGLKMCFVNLSVYWLLDIDIGNNDRFMLWIDKYTDGFGSYFNYPDSEFFSRARINTAAVCLDSYYKNYLEDIYYKKNLERYEQRNEYINCIKLQQKFKCMTNKKFKTKGNVNRGKYMQKARKHMYHRW